MSKQHQPQVKAMALALYASGLSFYKVGVVLNVSGSTVHTWCSPEAASKQKERCRANYRRTKEQRQVYKKEYRASNKEAICAYNKEYWQQTKESRAAVRAASGRRYYENNREKIIQAAKKYNANNKEKVAKRKALWVKQNYNRVAAASAARRAIKLKAQPAWLTPEQQRQIDAMFTLRDKLKEATGIKYHVDHIVPLTAKRRIKGKYKHVACGLHVPWNLQVIPAKQNLSKWANLGTLEHD